MEHIKLKIITNHRLRQLKISNHIIKITHRDQFVFYSQNFKKIKYTIFFVAE